MSLDDTLEDLKERAKIVIDDDNDYMSLFKTLKSEIITSYLKNDFRVSNLKKICSKLIAIISLAEK